MHRRLLLTIIMLGLLSSLGWGQVQPFTGKLFGRPLEITMPTGYAGGSVFLYQVGTVHKFEIDKDGALIVGSVAQSAVTGLVDALNAKAPSSGIAQSAITGLTDALAAKQPIPAQIVTVGASGSGAQYATIAAAHTAISDAAANKPYTITLYPGTYSENVVCEDYVSIVGTNAASCIIASGGLSTATGEPGQTPTYMVVNGASHMRLANLTIENTLTGSSVSATGVFFGASTHESTIEDCIITALCWPVWVRGDNHSVLTSQANGLNPFWLSGDSILVYGCTCHYETAINTTGLYCASLFDLSGASNCQLTYNSFVVKSTFDEADSYVQASAISLSTGGNLIANNTIDMTIGRPRIWCIVAATVAAQTTPNRIVNNTIRLHTTNSVPYDGILISTGHTTVPSACPENLYLEGNEFLVEADSAWDLGAWSLTVTEVGISPKPFTITTDRASLGNGTLTYAPGTATVAWLDPSVPTPGTTIANTPAGGIAATTAQAAVNELDGEMSRYRPDDIFQRFPQIGSTLGFSSDSPGASADCIFYLASGSGVVRALRTIGFASWANLSALNVHLRVYTDAGTIADLTAPPADHLTADIPLHTLLSCNYDTTGVPDVLRSTAHYKVFPSTTYDCHLFLDLPILFSGGVLIQLWEGAAHSANQGVYCGTYELGTLPAQWTAWRLRCRNVEATIPHGHDATATATFLDVASGAGVLAGVFGSMDGATAGSLGYAEDGVMFKLDGNVTANWTTGGVEDFLNLGASYFWGDWLAPQIEDDVGTPFTDNTAGQVEWYRWCTKEPLWWTNGCVGYWTNSNDGYNASVAVKMMTLYYSAN